MEHHGYLCEDYILDEYFQQLKEDGLDKRHENLYTSGAGAKESEDISAADEAGWKDRIDAIVVHVELCKQEKEA